ncbi:hypothetical protein ACFL5Q_07140 [Planctomycetota bacterium]
MTETDQILPLSKMIFDSTLFDENAPAPSGDLAQLATRLADLLREIDDALPEPKRNEPELVARLRFCVDWCDMDVID